MHREQIEFCLKIKSTFLEHFVGKRVLDAGSLDVNGTNRYLFEGCEYTGVDLEPGPNVDIAMPVHLYLGDARQVFDLIISTEMLEHDRYSGRSLEAMFWALKSGGLLLLTAAGVGRPTHGVWHACPNDSPFTKDYYRAITSGSIIRWLPPVAFSFYLLERRGMDLDLYFAGIKI